MSEENPPAVVDAVTGPWLKYRHLMLGFCTVGAFLLLLGQAIIPALASPIMTTVGIGNSEFGFALTLMWASYSLTQFPSGIISDQIGHKTLLIIGLAGIALGFGLLGIDLTYIAFLTATVAIGIGGGTFTMVRFRFLSYLFAENKGRALGISGGLSNLAGVVGPAMVPFLVAAASWQPIFLVLTGLALLLGLLFHVTVAEPLAFEIRGLTGRFWDSIDQISSVQIVAMTLVSGLYSLSAQAMTTFIPLYMSDSKDLSFALAGTMLSMYYLAGTVIRPVSGWLSDRTNRRLLSIASLLSSGLLLALLVVLANEVVLIIALFALFSVTFLSFSVSWDAYFMDIFDDSSMGGSFGLARTAHLLIGSAGPTLVGVGTETIGYDSSFLLLSAIVLLAAAIAVIFVE